MKRRIRIIFILMAACILGINLFQGYWLFSSYQLELQNLKKSVNEALMSAVKRQNLSDAKRTIRFHSDSLTQHRIAVNVTRAVDPDTLPGDLLRPRMSSWVGEKARQRIRQEESKMFMFRLPEKDKTDSLPFVADTLVREISSLLILNRFYERDFNLERLDTLYTAELSLRGAGLSYQLDTARTEAEEREDWLKEEATLINGALHTGRIPVNSLSNLVVRARFDHPFSFILKRMGGLLAASLVLFLLTTGCLVYMLRTILTQKRLSEIKNDFINNMTHELKTPIATVSAAVEALQHFEAMDDRAKARDYLDISRRELSRLSGMVEKVLNIAVEERRQLDLSPEPVELVQLLRDLVAHHQVRAGKAAAIRLEAELDDPVARVDKYHFTNVINNLIDNAIKYSYDEVDILLRCERKEGCLYVSVRDNGIGIPRDYQQSIFEKFFRVPTGDRHDVKGFGLGLSYVKKIIEKHGGRVTVRSELRRGSEFVISLPGDEGNWRTWIRGDQEKTKLRQFPVISIIKSLLGLSV